MDVGGGCPSAEWLEQYAEGGLDRRRTTAVESHLSVCARCREQVTELRSLQGLLAGWETPPPDRELAARILQAAAEAEPLEALSCREAARLASVSLDECNSAQQEARLWAHLGQCGTCLRSYRESERVVEALRGRVAPEAVPGLLSRVLSAVDQVRERRRRPALRWAPVGAAAVALALLAIFGLMPRGGGPDPAAMAERPAPAVPLAPVEAPPPPGEARLAEAPGAERPERHAEEAGARIRELGERALRSVTRRQEAPTRTGTDASAVAARGTATVAEPSRATPVAPVTQPQPSPAVERPTSPPAVRPVTPSPTRPPAEATPEPARPLAPTIAPPSVAVAERPELPRPQLVPPTTPSPVPAGTRPVVGHTPAEQSRELRWTPARAQPVIEVEFGSESREAALAGNAETLNRYGAELARSEPKQINIR